MKEYIAVFIGCAVLFAVAVLPDCAHAAGRPNPPMTYYVDSVAGNDNNAGTIDAPWETPAAPNRTTLWPGDHVLFKRGGIFGAAQRDTCLVVPSDGVADSVITFGAYGTGAMPVITGARHITGWDSVGVNLYQHVKDVPDSAYALWFGNVLGTRVMTQATLSANLEWRNTADTLFVYLTSPADTMFIDRSYKHAIYSNKNYITIRELDVQKGTGIGISTTVTHTASINIADGANIIIERCTIRYALNGIQMWSYPATIQNCFFILIRYRDVLLKKDGETIYNCTFFRVGWGVWIYGANNCVVKNNIFYLPSTSFIQIVLNQPGQSNNLISDNNIFYATSYANKWIKYPSNISTLSAWQDSTGQDLNSIVADPRFVNEAAGDYRSLYPRFGVNLYSAGVTTDITGKARPTSGKFSAGAYQRNARKAWGEVSNEIGGEIRVEVRSW